MVNKRISFALLAVVVLPLMSGCNRHSKSEQYYLIATNTAVPYWKAGAAGFESAGTEYGVSVDTRGPAGLNPQAEVDEFKAMVARKPAGILVSVTDQKLLQPQIDSAIAARAGALLVSLTNAHPRHRFHDALLVATRRSIAIAWSPSATASLVPGRKRRS